MNFDQAIISLGDKDEPWAQLFKFSHFPAGPKDAVERMPENTPGVYFWFRTYDYPDSPNEFWESLTADISKKKFPARSGTVAPYLDVTIESKTRLPAGKSKDIKLAIEHDSFRKQLTTILGFSVLFQTPLYIGKSEDLRKRTLEHLEYGSSLSTRLEEAEINIEETCLLIVPVEPLPKDLKGFDSEILFEEVFSRLFQPHFNLRIG